MTAAKHTTREAWLNAAADVFKPWFKDQGADYPEVLRISCGLAGSRIGGRRIGECWSDECSADHAREIFISPELGEPCRVMDVLIHELCHAALPFGVKHGPPFKQLAEALGLTGKMTATVASPDLQAKLTRIAKDLGPYPHAPLTALMKEKQTTRMIKVECTDCGCTVRTTAKWIEVGLPTCQCGAEMVAVVNS